ncbi:MAG: YggT family protein [Dehalococcoidia bacterium]
MAVPTETTTVRRQDTVVADTTAPRRAAADRVLQAVGIVFGVVATLIMVRFLLKLLGANPEAGFTSFVYSLSAPFVAPFRGIWNTSAAGGAVFEPESLVAFIVWILVAWLVAAILRMALFGDRGAVRTSTRSVDHHVE